MVIFLDDSKKHPKWTSTSSTFYAIPKKYNFRSYPAYAYHIWLTEKRCSASEYGSSVRISLANRKSIKDFIMQFKTFDSSILKEVNCSGKFQQNSIDQFD